MYLARSAHRRTSLLEFAARFVVTLQRKAVGTNCGRCCGPLARCTTLSRADGWAGRRRRSPDEDVEDDLEDADEDGPEDRLVLLLPAEVRVGHVSVLLRGVLSVGRRHAVRARPSVDVHAQRELADGALRVAVDGDADGAMQWRGHVDDVVAARHRAQVVVSVVGLQGVAGHVQVGVAPQRLQHQSHVPRPPQLKVGRVVTSDPLRERLL